MESSCGGQPPLSAILPLPVLATTKTIQVLEARFLPLDVAAMGKVDVEVTVCADLLIFSNMRMPSLVDKFRKSVGSGSVRIQ